MIAILCGGRDYSMTWQDWATLNRLRKQHGIRSCCCGMATGADYDGWLWAVSNSLYCKPFPAKWDDLKAPGAVIKRRADGTEYNAVAGHVRNEQMAKYAANSPYGAICIAFPGGTGTADMVTRAKRNGITVIRIRDGKECGNG